MEQHKPKNKNNDLFRNMMYEFMMNYSDNLQSDRDQIINRVSLHNLSADDVYDMVVSDTRQDTATSIFRSIRVIMQDYLE